MEPRSAARTPPALYCQALLSHLDNVRTACEPNVQQHAAVQLHTFAAQLVINEVALSDDPLIREQFDAMAPPSWARLRHLHACVSAIKSWTDVFFSLRPVEIRGWPVTLMLQFRHCIGMLFILSTLDDPLWSKEDVRSTIDLTAIIERACNLFRSVADASGIDTDLEVRGQDVWTHSAEKMHTLATNWAVKLVPQPATVSENGYANLAAASGVNSGLFADWSALDFEFDWGGANIY
ncbi:hypothetical protein LTR53_013178 [Teratosphaeriaceae sp. CCFEE 6253]|nr:hypothetical protein LTR53_013178 [Teratosphaeriaceae sp. CCFEE 6253]